MSVTELRPGQDTAKIPGKRCWDTSGSEKVCNPCRSLQLIEQETVLVKCRTDEAWHVTVSDQTELTRLRKNPLFRVRRLVVSPQGKILEAQGTLPAWAISYRTKTRR